MNAKKREREQKRRRRVARKLPTFMQHIAFTKARPAGPSLGRFGAASEVRRIDPAEYTPPPERER